MAEAAAAEAETNNPLLRYIVSGGSRALITPVVTERPKKVRNHADRMVKAKASMILKLGLHQSIALKNSFDSLNEKESTKDAADGMIQAMFDLKFSCNEVRVLFGVGGHRIDRIKQKKVAGRKSNPRHAATAADILRLTAHMDAFPKEDAFPCAHRRPRQYLLSPTGGDCANWTEVWLHYKAEMDLGGHRVLSWSRWRQYIQRLFPGVLKNRTCEDLCDSCVRIEVELKRTDLSPDERAALEAEKIAHLGAAKAQRQAMNDAIKKFALKHALVTDADAEVPALPAQMPGGYTANYMFEFDAGVCTYRQLATTPDAEAQQVSLLPAG